MVQPMDYDTVVEAFFRPSSPGVVPAPVLAAAPARRLRDAVEPLAMHSVWSRRTNEQLAGLGLDFFGGYVWGRAAGLGEPDPGVVVSSFAVFESAMLTSAYEQARSVCPRDEMLAARAEATIESLHDALVDVDVAPVADALATAVAAADPTGRPLFAGISRQPWPDDPVGRLWRACELAREHRGDSHVAASIARGLDPITMNVLTELWVGMPLGSYSATRGWSPEQIEASAVTLRADGLVEGDELTAAGRRARDELEATTDAMERSIVEALGSDIDALVGQLDEWSARCVAAGSFPPDVFKRAAG
jgi:Helix-turn-helix family